ncbi:hypothetical protein BRAS3843_240019 [Bradyrhizobium sp. STM 3843]|nr:hypothetical protein BRAS3843_240019 [Bradyrhizobium sp. STM 3843]
MRTAAGICAQQMLQPRFSRMPLPSTKNHLSIVNSNLDVRVILSDPSDLTRLVLGSMPMAGAAEP